MQFVFRTGAVKERQKQEEERKSGIKVGPVTIERNLKVV